MKRTVYSDLRTMRTQVIMILLGTALIIFGLWAFVLHPLHEEVRACQDAIGNVESELAVFQVQIEDGGLPARLAEASARNRWLEAEWSYLRNRVDTFRGDTALRETLPTYDDGRIDYKVALFEARGQLVDAAQAAKVVLPEDLGIPETIGTEERAETRLWQLVGLVRLVQLAIDSRFPEITQIEADAPETIVLGADATEVAMEFPTRLVLRCAFGQLAAFLDRLSREETFFAIRRLKVERMNAQGAQMLKVEIVVGAFLFQSYDEISKLEAEQEKETLPPGPSVNGRRRRSRGEALPEEVEGDE